MNTLFFLLDTAFSLYLMVVLLRFWLQWAKADFYNPLSQVAVKLTHPILSPLRRIIPGFRGIDFASLLLALHHGYALELAVRTGLYDMRQAVLAGLVGLLFALGINALRRQQA